MSSHFDAVIIGAGPAGSAAAILLARAGWSVALVERQDFPRRKVCGECIAASNLPLLQLLGIGALFESHAGVALRQVAVVHGDAVALADLPAAPGRSDAQRWGRPLGRATLDLLLIQQAERVGAEVWQPWSVQAVDGTAGRWQCELRSSLADVRATLCAPVLIAANGGWERTPWQATGPRRPHAASDLLAFKANFVDARLPEGLLPLLALDGGYGGMVVSAPGVTTVACCVRRDCLTRLRGAAPQSSAGDAVEAWLRRQSSVVSRSLSDARRDAPWLAAGPITPGIRLRDDDAILRIGNAAGEAHPILGEGISMALQSAALLCGRLLAGSTPGLAPGAGPQAVIARDYAAQWRARFAPRLRVAALLAQVAMRPHAADLLLGLAKAWPGLLTHGARWGGKTQCAADLPALAWALGKTAPASYAPDTVSATTHLAGANALSNAARATGRDRFGSRQLSAW